MVWDFYRIIVDSSFYMPAKQEASLKRGCSPRTGLQGFHSAQSVDVNRDEVLDVIISKAPAADGITRNTV